jgi:mannose-6-phosphate isomerase-like protein (cupin superfamily)
MEKPYGAQGRIAVATHSAEQAHDFDEYMMVVQGCYTLIIGARRIPVRAGEEYLIPKGVVHSGEVVAGTRTIHAFGGHRADRVTTAGIGR